MPKIGKLENKKLLEVSTSQDTLAVSQAEEDIRTIMSLPAGRRFMYRLVYGICGVENGIWSASAEIHYLEGRRSVGINLKNEAQQLAPREYVQMIQEQIVAAAQHTATRAAIEEEDDNA